MDTADFSGLFPSATPIELNKNFILFNWHHFHPLRFLPYFTIRLPKENFQ